MSGEEQIFNNVTKQNLGLVTFGDNSKARAVYIGFVGFAGTTQVEQVLLVDSLKHNFLSISQLCDEENIVIFEHDKCIIKTLESEEARLAEDLEDLDLIKDDEAIAKVEPTAEAEDLPKE